MEQTKARIEAILQSNKYANLATATKDGEPWISAVYFAFDADYTIYWASSKNARHSKLLEENNKAALVIYSINVTEGNWDSLYFNGSAFIVGENEFPHALDVYYGRGHPILSEDDDHPLYAKDFLGESARRLYRFVPEKAYLVKPPVPHSSQELITTRIEVSLKKDSSIGEA